MRTKSFTKAVKASGQKSRLDFDNGNCIRIDSGCWSPPGIANNRETGNITGGPFKIFLSRIVSWDRAESIFETEFSLSRGRRGVERNGEEIEAATDRYEAIGFGRCLSNVSFLGNSWSSVNEIRQFNREKKRVFFSFFF